MLTTHPDSLSRRPFPTHFRDWCLRRWFACAVLLMGLICGVSASADDTPQQRWVGDLPIMKGMTIEPELGFAFDSPSGRIVLVIVASDQDRASIMAFYETALESLGWQGRDGTWTRGDESLSLSQVDTSVGRLWRIRLSPK